MNHTSLFVFSLILGLTKLILAYSETLLPPRVSSPQTVIHAKEGQTKVVLECQLDVGDHPVAFKWFKQYKLVTGDLGFAYRTHRNVHLALHTITQQHAGIYECEAKNDAGAHATSIEVIVEPSGYSSSSSVTEGSEDLPDAELILSEFAASLNDVLAEGNCSCDVLFLIHVSPDADNDTVAAQANFVHTLADPLISDDIRIGIMTYSDYANTKLPLGGDNDACALKRAFLNLSHEKWSTRIQPVLRDAFKKFKKSPKDKCKILFLPIFGSLGSEGANSIVSNHLKKIGVEIFILEVTESPLPGVRDMATERGDGRPYHWWVPIKMWYTIVSYMSYMEEELIGCVAQKRNLECLGPGLNCTNSDQCQDIGYGCIDGVCQNLQCDVNPDLPGCCSVPGDFWCGDVTATCKSRDQKCDGKINCMNGRDEEVCWQTSCKENEARCQSSTLCLSVYDLCDGHPHCPAAEDEDPKFCRSFPCPKDRPFRCLNGKCISTESVCDGAFRDCSDGGDENLEYCSKQHVCPTSRPFKCDYGVCVPEKMVCDGAFNCLDALDERLCEERNCPPERPFKCGNGKCVALGLVCNGVVDACTDGSDEMNCTSFSCPSERSYKCRNGRCIDKWLECDYRDDCGDGTDELNCGGRYSPSSSPPPSPPPFPSRVPTLSPLPTKSSCLEGEFFCESGVCLPLDKVCDGRRNCIDGEDERPENCSRKPCSTDGQIRCLHTFECVFGGICDGIVHCSDKTDEANCFPDDADFSPSGANEEGKFDNEKTSSAVENDRLGTIVEDGIYEDGRDEYPEEEGDLLETNVEDAQSVTNEKSTTRSGSGEASQNAACFIFIPIVGSLLLNLFILDRTPFS